jgi:hypothetical protein
VTPLQVAAYSAEVLAAATAVALARRQRGHRPAAVALVALSAGSILHALTAAALTPYQAEPWEGSARLLVYLDGALTLAADAALAGFAIAVAVSPERQRRVAAITIAVWLAASVVLGALYPSPLVRGASLQRVYFAAELITLFVATGAIVTWARAGIAAKRSPSGVQTLALGMVLLDGAILLAPFSPWRLDLFSVPFGGIQLVITIFFAVVATAQVIAWRAISPG